MGACCVVSGAPKLLAEWAPAPHHVRRVAVNAVSLLSCGHSRADRAARLTSGRAALEPSLGDVT